MDNYKGIYYNDSKEQRFYEGGAHFRYKDLYKILLTLGGRLNEDNTETKKEKNIMGTSPIDINDLLGKNKSRQQQRGRNISQFSYINNPNTQINLNGTGNSGAIKNSLSINKIYYKQSRNLNRSLIKSNNFNKTSYDPSTKVNQNLGFLYKIQNNATNLRATRNNNYSGIHHSNVAHIRYKSDLAVNNVTNIPCNKISPFKMNKEDLDSEIKNNVNIVNKKNFINNINSNNVNVLNNGNFFEDKLRNSNIILSKANDNLLKDKLNDFNNSRSIAMKEKSRNSANKTSINYLRSSNFQTNNVMSLNGTALRFNDKSIINNNTIINANNNGVNKIDNNIKLQKYIKKKINQLYVFNNNNKLKNSNIKGINHNNHGDIYISNKVNGITNISNNKKFISRNPNAGTAFSNSKYNTTVGMNKINNNINNNTSNSGTKIGKYDMTKKFINFKLNTKYY